MLSSLLNRLRSGLSAVAAACLLLAWMPAASTTFHVSTSGSDGNAGTAAKPFRTIQKAIGVAQPGDSILVHAGTYPQRLQINRSGSASQRIVLAAAGDGAVIVNPALPALDCTRTSPDRRRAIEIAEGADHWTIHGLNVAGGILVAGKFPAGFPPNAEGDRTLPGRGLYDPAGARTLLPSLGVNPADGIRIVSSKITDRGVLAVGARDGILEGSEVANTQCGSGAAVLLSRFSDFWTIRNDFVHHTAPHAQHFMSEGIRISNASNYNLIEANRVEDMGGKGRGVATDVNASWNVFRANEARRAHAGFNEQTGGWGNKWQDNVAEANREYGYSINVKDEFFAWPDGGVPLFIELRCNLSLSNPIDMYIGLVQNSTFAGHAFTRVRLGENLRSLWGPLENTWEGISEAPPPRPAPRACS